MLASGDLAWNGGIFLFRADIFLEDEVAAHAPTMLTATQDAMRPARFEGRAFILMRTPLLDRRRFRSTMQ
jgi:mannose-1-phosphate guanylyltransferase